MLVRLAPRTFDATASALLNRSWPRLKRSPHAFAVKSADHAVAVFVCIHWGDRFVCLVVTATIPPAPFTAVLY
jgi:hypothetical protein